MVNAVPRMLTVRVGKMRKKLNTTSSDIITTLIMLGTTMLPLLRSIPEPKMENWNAGIPHGDDGEVGRRRGVDVGVSAKPYGQEWAYGECRQTQNHAHGEHRHDALAQCVACLGTVVGTQLVAHLHIEACRRG